MISGDLTDRNIYILISNYKKYAHTSRRIIMQRRITIKNSTKIMPDENTFVIRSGADSIMNTGNEHTNECYINYCIELGRTVLVYYR